MSKPKTRKTKFDESSSSGNQSTSQIPKTKRSKEMLETEKIDDKELLIMDVACQDFKKIRYQPGFIDKTMMIQAVLNQSSKILITAPRRFGKSVNISMLKYFFELVPNEEIMEENRKIFEGLNIASYVDIMNEYQGKYPVIYPNFKSHGKISSVTEARRHLCSIVCGSYLEHQYLASSDKLVASNKRFVERWCDENEIENLGKCDDDIYDALKNLARYLKKHWNKDVIVLSDEYDSICSDAVLYIPDIKENLPLPPGRLYRESEAEINEVIAVSVGSLSCLLKADAEIPVTRGIMTGISYLMTMGASKLNNLEPPFKFNETHCFSPFYGLSEDELKSLLRRLKEAGFGNFEPKLDRIVDFYDGYNNKKISVWSIMNCLNKRGTLRKYWNDSGVASELHKALKITKMRCLINKLTSDISNTIKVRSFSKISYENLLDLIAILRATDPDIEAVDIYVNLLLEQGYLSVCCIYEEEDMIELKIPNKEIKLEFLEKLHLFYERTYRINFTQLRRCSSILDEIASSVKNQKSLLEHFCEELNVLFKSIKFEIFNEATFHHVIFFILLYSKGKCFSELYCSNRNILDLLMLMLSEYFGLIFELKFGIVSYPGERDIKNADAALYQILCKEYIKAFESDKYNPEKINVKNYALVGLHLSSDKCVSLSVLLNNTDYSKKINYPKS